MSDPGEDQLGPVLAALSAEATGRAERGRLLLRLVAVLGRRARGVPLASVAGGQWLSELVAEAGQQLPVRDLLTLREAHGGRSGDDLADALVRSASVVTGALGAAGGALAAAEFAAPPTLLAAPVQLVAETLAVIAVELKLVAELHVVYGRAPRGSRLQLAAAYLSSWVTRRGITTLGGEALGGVAGRVAARQLRRRLVRRLGRSSFTLAPFLAGALAGAEVNRRETRALGAALQRDLGGRRSGADGLGSAQGGRVRRD